MINTKYFGAWNFCYFFIKKSPVFILLFPFITLCFFDSRKVLTILYLFGIITTVKEI